MFCLPRYSLVPESRTSQDRSGSRELGVPKKRKEPEPRTEGTGLDGGQSVLDSMACIGGYLWNTQETRVPATTEERVAFSAIHRLLLAPVGHMSPANGDRPHRPAKFMKFANIARDKVRACLALYCLYLPLL